ncbi:Ribosome hibernation promoting factor [Pseudodesulfovibrio profundus]|uniref:Ribosome hibernation promoting factor n=1 Tax=Pseudodesulfovibrio profundus TaxID=57320 RepID=A0A2C8F499_9BACT|nr:ribosome-associated translation inhibitor RaiA [Pseudodesulfovibrio profundus]MBC18372.1 ribosomal subunit interface protein [Desulfovibrio sp.]SOB57214.1 Ribosome hibernation promoting factor [Pseudodesulfovibrio profundus]|tara:strand:+ start:1844 stop:2386 length:543 start_codon:yes stop_codon:yes gene_type:complete
MNISFTFKDFEPSDHLKGYAQKRFEKVGKFVSDSDEADLQVNLSVDKFRHKADVILNADNIHISAYEDSEDMYATIDMVVDKLEAQLRKMREKMKSRVRSGRGNKVQTNFFAYEESNREAGPTIVGTDTYEPKPMSIDEAALQLNSLDNDFLVFLNAETEGVNVIYRRKNGDYGLIDPGN